MPPSHEVARAALGRFIPERLEDLESPWHEFLGQDGRLAAERTVARTSAPDDRNGGAAADRVNAITKLAFKQQLPVLNDSDPGMDAMSRCLSRFGLPCLRLQRRSTNGSAEPVAQDACGWGDALEGVRYLIAQGVCQSELARRSNSKTVASSWLRSWPERSGLLTALGFGSTPTKTSPKITLGRTSSGCSPILPGILGAHRAEKCIAAERAYYTLDRLSGEFEHPATKEVVNKLTSLAASSSATRLTKGVRRKDYCTPPNIGYNDGGMEEGWRITDADCAGKSVRSIPA